MICLFLAFSPIFAQKYAVKDVSFKEYTASVKYNRTVCPGDAVFLKLELKPKTAKSRKKIGLSTAKIEFFDEEKGKKINGSKMYFFNQTSINSKNNAATKIKSAIKPKYESDVLFSGVPLSSYIEPRKYYLKVIFSAFGMEEVGLVLPVTIKEKKFVEETLHLNAQNTAIKTDSSPARTQQINKLNEILDTADYDAVFQKGAFTPPTTATRRTSFFADRRIYAYNNGKSSTSLHYGIDYGIPTGSEVKSCAAGLVMLAEWRNSTGWSIVIEHLPNLYSLYYHLDEMLVKEGDFVNTGDLIGKSGATGLATGPHLHWEIRLKMEAVNPDFFIENFDWD